MLKILSFIVSNHDSSDAWYMFTLLAVLFFGAFHVFGALTPGWPIQLKQRRQKESKWLHSAIQTEPHSLGGISSFPGLAQDWSAAKEPKAER